MNKGKGVNANSQLVLSLFAMSENRKDTNKRLKVRQHLSGAVSHNSCFFGSIKYGIYNIYFKVISLIRQIKILVNDMKHYLAAKQKNLC